MGMFYHLSVTLLLVTTPLYAKPISVNTRQTSAQCNPSVVTTPDGGFVAVWSSYYSSSGRSNEIIARRFDSAGQPLDADEFQVNTTCIGNQTEPAVATRPGGGFVVAWEGPGNEGIDVYARLFDAHGVPVGDEVRVNTALTGQRAFPRAAVARDGSFIVVWEDSGADATGMRTIWGQCFDASGDYRRLQQDRRHVLRRALFRG